MAPRKLIMIDGWIRGVIALGAKLIVGVTMLYHASSRRTTSLQGTVE